MTKARTETRDNTTKRDQGFSLLEILIALAILALAMTVVGVSFARSSVTFRFEAASEQLALDLREAQARALRSGKDVAVVIDVDNRTYRLQQDAPVQLVPEIAMRVVSAGQVMQAGRQPAFSFMPDGGSSGGSITLSLEDRISTITVDWLTGAVGITEGVIDAPQG
jgi:general secretion pathway protein H